ncbi:Salicylic acid-binding protein 2 [Tripterygium wilfordii]|uniref:(S)-hydroxynitrile lyase n=1 Tax=Tripterygium wilfordii TaxID=458696 RepID=A0A7J7E2W4_TRIWF|nr:salicylic acid-binding protein 2-like [Tripterygium wilfordii]KAF5752927.1 Salicylic acid-binding protein 2 [Tripterygium wilfordii]
MVEVMKQEHFVLVHGACHGAWSWYKLKPRLEAAGHRVTTLDLAASGIDRKAIEDVHSIDEYSEPLLEIMASLPHDEKVILVGHSLGGLSLALAMDKFPEKISVAVFLTAFMPDTTHPASYILDQYNERTPAKAWLDTQFAPYGDSDPPLMTMFFGPKFFASKLYQLSPVEDLELSKVLARPGSLFLADLAKAKKFTNEGYGAVTRVFVLCGEDKAIPVEFQRWMIQNSPVQEVLEIMDADHMPMNSKTQELCDCLVEIAQKHS